MSDDDPIVERIERSLGYPGLIDALAALPPTDVTSFLLALARRRADAVTPAGLVRAHASNRLVQPSPLDPRALRACVARLLELVPLTFDIVDPGDLLVITAGTAVNIPGSTNVIKVDYA